MTYQPPQLVLFQGDSITDCGRDRSPGVKYNDGPALGGGYAGMVAARSLAEHPGFGLRFLNRGNSGHRVVDLYARWKMDAINLQPDILSILIGVNDTWHEFSSGNGVEPERYAQVYRMMLNLTLERLPDVYLVLCEPFTLPCGVVTPEWMGDMQQRQDIVRDLAGEFGAVFVPFQKMFTEACQEASPEYWLPDGVHPSPAGHARMAELWMKSLETLAQ
jgi:lysophospholipase L1-like esterase